MGGITLPGSTDRIKGPPFLESKGLEGLSDIGWRGAQRRGPWRQRAAPSMRVSGSPARFCHALLAPFLRSHCSPPSPCPARGLSLATRPLAPQPPLASAVGARYELLAPIPSVYNQRPGQTAVPRPTPSTGVHFPAQEPGLARPMSAPETMQAHCRCAGALGRTRLATPWYPAVRSPARLPAPRASHASPSPPLCPGASARPPTAALMPQGALGRLGRPLRHYRHY